MVKRRIGGALTLILMMHVIVGIGSAQPPVSSRRLPASGHSVVVVLIDDIGVDMVGSYERFYEDHPNPSYPVKTPALDYLADTGLLFTNAWTNPRCSPTRAQVLTGQHARTTGIGNTTSRTSSGSPGLSPELVTIPTVLRPVYRTAAVGKWHLADASLAGSLTHPLGTSLHPWFHLYAGSLHNLNHESYNLWTKTFSTSILGPVPGSMSGQEDECSSPPCEALVSDYATVDTADDAIHLVKTLREPFFLYVAFNAPHRPLEPPVENLQPASCKGRENNPECSSTFDGSDIPSDTRCMVQWVDSELGRLICAVEDPGTGPSGPVTIIVMGDNGTVGGHATSERDSALVAPFDYRHGKHTLYQGGVNVPLIIKSPLISHDVVGGFCEALVCSTDILATVAELGGVSLPEDPHSLRDSVSMVPYLHGVSNSLRNFVYAEKFSKNFIPDSEGKPPGSYRLDKHKRVIRDVAGFKLLQLVTPATGGFFLDEEFYDLRVDPHEQVDLIGEVDRIPFQNAYLSLAHQLSTVYPHLVTR